jgi:hypothetical protein
MSSKHHCDDRTNPSDRGRTGAGSVSGQKQRIDVNDEKPIRNHDAPPRRTRATHEDPVMPSNDSALNTKI